MAAEAKIGNYQVRVEPLPALQAHELLGRILKHIGITGAELVSQTGGRAVRAQAEGTLDEVALEVLSAIMRHMSLADTAEMTSIMVDLLRMVQIREDNAWTELIPDHHFGTDLLGMYKVVAFALETQFGPFLKDLAGSFLKKKSPTLSATQRSAA